MDDQELINCCIQKDFRAWQAFVKKYSNLIFIAAQNRLKKYGFNLSYQEIEDIRQHILTSLWKDNRLQTIKNQRDISYWLAVVSGNEAMNYIKMNQAQVSIKSTSLFEEVGGKELADMIPSGILSPLDETVRNEISERLEDAIESLPLKERLVIKLNLIHHKKYHEIVNLLDLPPGTVSTYLKRAKEKIKEALKDFK